MMWLLLSAILALTLLLLATLRETKARRTALESELSALQERVSALIKGVAGQSKKLEATQGQLTVIQQRMDKLAHRMDTPPDYRWAIKNAASGKSAEELIGSHGLTRGEAELLTGLNRRPEH